jgi:hypothetical protein
VAVSARRAAALSSMRPPAAAGLRHRCATLDCI